MLRQSARHPGAQAPIRAAVEPAGLGCHRRSEPVPRLGDGARGGRVRADRHYLRPSVGLDTDPQTPERAAAAAGCCLELSALPDPSRPITLAGSGGMPGCGQGHPRWCAACRRRSITAMDETTEPRAPEPAEPPAADAPTPDPDTGGSDAPTPGPDVGARRAPYPGRPLRRSRDNRVVAGVCGALARYRCRPRGVPGHPRGPEHLRWCRPAALRHRLAADSGRGGSRLGARPGSAPPDRQPAVRAGPGGDRPGRRDPGRDRLQQRQRRAGPGTHRRGGAAGSPRAAPVGGVTIEWRLGPEQPDRRRRDQPSCRVERALCSGRRLRAVRRQCLRGVRRQCLRAVRRGSGR